ncbi:MAG: sugar transferase [Betaproteobacteria bacterium]|nr:sugar transferase [Betaproteobacteria bacterium]
MRAKRLFDIACSLAGLIVLLPLFLLVGAMIKMDSSGPVFFRQVRVGQQGRLFRIHKFRTMIADADAKGPTLTVGADPRVTRIGTYLRKYKLDELPQIIDVLSGTMSLVGPRPEVPRYVAHYGDENRRIVLSVKPGITDEASIRFRDEQALLREAENPEEYYVTHVLPIKLRYYRDYVATRTFLGDLRTILRTLGVIFQ